LDFKNIRKETVWIHVRKVMIYVWGETDTMEVYLDNSATTKVTDAVCDKMKKVLCEDYGNPSSMHLLGVRAEQYMKESAGIIADSLKVEPKELVYTSSGTEANNLALIGAAMANKRNGRHIISTEIEHSSVHQALAYLKENGFTISLVPVDETGKIRKEKLYEFIREDTILVSVMYVNNEIGAVEDIAEIASELKRRKGDILFHVDAIQAYGKYRIFPKREGIDLLTFSGHKIHGPKGIGVLYIKDKVKVNPILFGGGQQRGLRSGTENVPAIAGIGKAVSEIYTDFDEKIQKMYERKQLFLREVSALDKIRINGLPKECGGDFAMDQIKETAPHIMSVSFEGVRSEVLLHALEERGVYVSSGSACSSHHPQPSATLTAIGLPKDLIGSTLRFSMSELTKEQEIRYTVQQLKEILPMLRRYTRK
jgi:cysteine desulfurase